MRILRDGRGLVAISPTTAGIVNHEVDLSDWDDEELERGRRRDRRGGWGGKPPQLVAADVHAELVRRKNSRAYGLLRENVYRAVETLIEVATDRKVDPAVRLKAAEAIVDRVLGKPTERMQLDVDVMKPWQRLIANSIVGGTGPGIPRLVGTDEQAAELERQALEAATDGDDESAAE